MVFMHLVIVTGSMNVTVTEINWFVGETVWIHSKFNFGNSSMISDRKFST